MTSRPEELIAYFGMKPLPVEETYFINTYISDFKLSDQTEMFYELRPILINPILLFSQLFNHILDVFDIKIKRTDFQVCLDKLCPVLYRNLVISWNFPHFDFKL